MVFKHDKITHTMIEILLYMNSMFYEYRNMSAQECRHELKELINKEIFFGSLTDCAQTAKKSDIIMEFLVAMAEAWLCSIKVVKCCYLI